ncbi:hypothetical protein [Lachnospira multipara]|uniref:Ribosomal protein L14E/L6E/L27E n=1 Tax=Lachnospira multipara TaxID=28051 RepID=A0A1H5SZB7_9FIRM|nr:hypothetical protein [Lachnospira multipara]SEF55886.1 hypothetical protein SAMN05216537_103211 [Lachnospira multipara]
MINELKGLMAKSLVGHDKDKIYIVIGEDSQYVYLSDGYLKMCEKPKKKKKKHVQIIKNENSLLYRKIQENQKISDEEIKLEIKQYISKRN